MHPTYIGRHRAHGRHRAPRRWQKFLAARQPWALHQHFGLTAAAAATTLIGSGVLGGLL